MGVITKGANSIFFGRWLVLFFEVITGLAIMLGLFGWMDLLIVTKWTYVMNPYDGNINNTATAPSIITVMINNFLYGGYTNPATDANPNPTQYYFFNGQRDISEALVLVALICVPLMLCCKPLITIYTHKSDHGAAEFDRVEPVDEDAQPMRLSSQKDAEDGKADIKTYEDLLN
jgi:vacuolar-type H+-ATPase subunit I/STV1